jgi:hypothetical protein
MIWLLHPPPPVIKLDLRDTGRLRKRDNLLHGRAREELNHTTARMLPMTKTIRQRKNSPTLLPIFISYIHRGSERSIGYVVFVLYIL